MLKPQLKLSHLLMGSHFLLGISFFPLHSVAGEVNTTLPLIRALEQKSSADRSSGPIIERRATLDLLTLPNTKERGTYGNLILKPTPSTFLNDAIATIKVRFVGPSVDFELNSFLEDLATRRPDILHPTPIDIALVDRICINNFSAIETITTDLNNTDPDILLKSLITQNHQYIPPEKGGPSKYLVTPSTLAHYDASLRNRPSSTHALDIKTLTAEDAFRIIDFSTQTRFRLTGIKDSHLAKMLRNTFVVNPNHPAIISALQEIGGTTRDGILGARTISAINESTPIQFWSNFYRSLRDALHCRDADNIFRVYGLSYRQSDYKKARRIIESLTEVIGTPSVPQLSMANTFAVRVESVRPDCTVFAPIGYNSNCIVEKITVNNTERHVAIAGGVDVTFAMFKLDEKIATDIQNAANASGGVDRRRVSVFLDSPAQPQSWLSDGADQNSVPCIENFSNAFGNESRQLLQTHISRYQKLFYLQPYDGPKLYPIIQLLDRFPTPTAISGSFKEAGLPLPVRYIGQNVIKQSGLFFGNDILGSMVQRLTDTFKYDDYLRKLCDERDSSLRLLREHTHGHYVRGLLVGTTAPLSGIQPIGILTINGTQDENVIGENGDSLVEGVNVVDGINLLESLSNSVKRINFIKSYPDLAINPNIVINVSQTVPSFTHAFKRDLYETIQGLSYSGLVVASSGAKASMPDNIDVDALDASTSMEQTGPECDVYPACFGYHPNVITVGALDNSRKFLQELPLLDGTFAGTAVSVVAPSVGILSSDLHYLQEPNGLGKLQSHSVRDGSSAGAAFVSALAAEIMSRFSGINARDTKARILSTAGKYTNSQGQPELLKGSGGEIFAGAIDVKAALLDPRRFYVKSSSGNIVEYDSLRFVKHKGQHRTINLYPNTLESATPHLACNWDDLLRLHVFDINHRDYLERPILRAALMCRSPSDPGRLLAGNGYLGTSNNKEDPCIGEDRCFQGRNSDNGAEDWIKLRDIKDIYFAVRN